MIINNINSLELITAIERASNILNITNHKDINDMTKKQKEDSIQLNNIQLIAKNEVIQIIANNTKEIITIIVNGDVQDEGEISIHKDNFKLISKLIGDINISTNNSESMINIEGKRSISFVNYTQIDKFLSDHYYTVDPFKPAFTMPENEFKQALKIKSAISIDENRQPLQVLCIRNNCFYTCNGCKIIKLVTDINNTCDKDLLIPLNAVIQLDKILDKRCNKDLHFEFSMFQNEMRYLKISNDSFTYITSLYNCEYLNIEKILPSEFTRKITLNSKELSDSLDFAEIAVEPKNKKDPKIPIIFEIKEEKYKDSFTLKVCNKDKMINESITCKEFIFTDPLKIAFSIDFITDSLKVLNEKNDIELLFTSDIGPMILKSKESDKEIHMILPVKIK